jgi:AmmeMemoRadiSam system protein A
MASILSEADKGQLMKLAREALEAAVRGEAAPPVDLAGLSPDLRRPGCSFVTLTEQGNLRGCIGALHAIDPLYEDVRLHAAQAALEDYRFVSVVPAELPRLEIEISVLSEPQPLAYDRPEDLLRLLRPNVDGVVLLQGMRRATFLPQVWEDIPDPAQFLGRLCEKMGREPGLWRKSKLDVQTYQVEKFTEAELRHPPQTAAPDQ